MILQSGIIPFRVHRRRWQVLLVTTRRGVRWTIPKGHLIPGLTLMQSAIQEAFEEAGIAGNAWPHAVGSYTHVKRAAARRVQVFAMEVTRTHATWPEMLKRDRCWHELEVAASLVFAPRLAELIVSLPKKLETRLAASA